MSPRTIFSTDFPNFDDYYSQRNDFWKTLGSLQDQHADRSYFVTWTSEAFASVAQPEPVFSHSDFMQSVREASSLVDSDLCRKLFSNAPDVDMGFTLTIQSSDQELLPGLRNYRVNRRVFPLVYAYLSRIGPVLSISCVYVVGGAMWFLDVRFLLRLAMAFSAPSTTVS